MATNGEAASEPTKQVSVLFVCLGNICRSPLAEGVFRNLTAQNPLISRIDSCGTGAYHAGDQPDSRTLSVLEQNGISGFRHKARKVKIPSDFEDFDHILAMDDDNLMDLKDMVKRAKKKGLLSGDEVQKVRLYGEFGGKSGDEEVGDPYYGGTTGFSVAYEQVERFGRGLLKHIEDEAKKG